MAHLKSYAKTDIGRWRKNNEDHYLIIDDASKGFDTHRYGSMFVVADGMGGHAAGEVASKMACKQMTNYYYRIIDGPSAPPSSQTLLNRIEAVILKANRNIYLHGQRNKEYYGMGTTLSVLVLWGSFGLIGHVGDSRIYRQRDRVLEQLTVDQTEVQALVEKGYLTPAQAAIHPYRNILLQAVGVSEDLEEVFTRIEAVKPGDVYLLCSDGLHDMVSDEGIQRVLNDYPDPQQACEHLIELALKYGGKDNVTTVVVQVQPS
ncbi:MAG: Stp1/IreP family PP2C-type Ser/Thr phosphatase [Deltaproteobacteria bacterium]|nr:Stp1/IreP family PP2C-type Ser/Thr phosphatase [Deltaproteobacteria bacterium]